MACSQPLQNDSGFFGRFIGLPPIIDIRVVWAAAAAAEGI